MSAPALSSLPSIDRLLSAPGANSLISRHGRQPLKLALQGVLADLRERILSGEPALAIDDEMVMAMAERRLETAAMPSLRTVYNLTGTVLHTNLGRAPLPPEAIERIVAVASEPSNLEYDLNAGERGNRDDHVESLLTDITGAEAATVVNNNAAAVLLTLNTFAEGREVVVSRGELVEIGGSFRIPEIMKRAGARLVEVGATNRTHPRDMEQAMGPNTALLMKVHTSNFEIRGFTRAVDEQTMARIAHEHGVPLVNDLGSGTLIDLTRYGLPNEPTVQAALEAGADLVTFSGDKLLGGPQAGIIVGRRELIDKIRRNPMKRALRVDKMTLAAIHEVLKLYLDPDRLEQRLPTLRLLTRSPERIEAVAREVAPSLETALSGEATIEVIACQGQIGSGAMPTDVLPGFGIAITPVRREDEHLQSIVRAMRGLPVPVIGRVSDGRLILDMRTVEEPAPLIEQFSRLQLR